jgi:hypothetical protein
MAISLCENCGCVNSKVSFTMPLTVEILYLRVRRTRSKMFLLAELGAFLADGCGLLRFNSENQTVDCFVGLT